MRCTFAILTVLTCCPVFALAQCGLEGCRQPHHPRTQVCRQPDCHECCPPRHTPESTPESTQQPEGSYVQGPATGEYAGESVSVGIRGGGIRIPEINIELPTIKLPSLIGFRRNPELITESARLPYVEGRAAEFAQLPRGGSPENTVQKTNPPKRTPEADNQPVAPPYCAPQNPYYFPSRNDCCPSPCNTTQLLEQLRQQQVMCQQAIERLSAQQASYATSPTSNRPEVVHSQPATYHNSSVQAINSRLVSSANEVSNSILGAGAQAELLVTRPTELETRLNQSTQEVEALRNQVERLTSVCEQLATSIQANQTANVNEVSYTNRQTQTDPAFTTRQPVRNPNAVVKSNQHHNHRDSAGASHKASSQQWVRTAPAPPRQVSNQPQPTRQSSWKKKLMPWKK